MNGRTDNSVKNRWNSTIKRKIKKSYELYYFKPPNSVAYNSIKTIFKIPNIFAFKTIKNNLNENKQRKLKI